MQLSRLNEERGSIWVIAAVFVPALILLGTFAVDVGNWFTHKRHLQTQADAAALAGGNAWKVNCDGAVNQAIIDATRAYAGPSWEDTHTLTPADATTPRYNAQIGGTPADNIHALLNSLQTIDNGGTSFSDAQPCTTSARPDQATYDPTAPLNQQNYIVDVKMTEKRLKWFFNLTGLGLGFVPTINAEARAKASDISGERGFVPIGVQIPKIYHAQATIRWCGTGSLLTNNTIVKLAPLNTVGTHLTMWVPDPTVYPSGLVPLNAPTSNTACGGADYGGPDVNIEVSGSPHVTPSTTNCNNQYVDCFDTVLLRDWKQGSTPSGEGDPLTFHNAQLLDQNCGANATPYWVSDQLSTVPCSYSLTTDVLFGGLPTLAGHTGFSATLTASAGGASQSITRTSGFGNPWIFTGLSTGAATPTVQGGFVPPNVSVSWSYSWATGPKKYNCTPAKPCTGSTKVQRSVANTDSPVGKVTVTDAAGVPLDSFNASGYPSSINLGVVIQDGGFVVGQKAILRTTSSQGSEALDCNNANNGQVFRQFENGCTPLYGRNTFALGTWEPCPNPNSFPTNPPAWLCVPQLPGGHGNQIVPDGFDAATKNCDKVNGGDNQCLKSSCHNPNAYVYGDPQHTYDPSDPRIIKLFLIPYASLNGVSGGGSGSAIEVVDFAAYYVTGWNGDPCKDTSSGGTDEPVKAGQDAVGYFVKLVDPDAVPDPAHRCDPTATSPCIITLVR